MFLLLLFFFAVVMEVIASPLYLCCFVSLYVVEKLEMRTWDFASVVSFHFNGVRI